MTRGTTGSLRGWIPFLAIVAVGLAAPPAEAQAPKKEPARAATSKPLSQTLTGAAKADFEAAKLLANDGDFAGALIKFQSAYDASKDPRLLWNVAFCQKNLRHYSKVVTTLRRYLEEGGSALTSSDKKEAQDLITTIEPFTTRATIHVSEDGAQISVDDESVGVSPLAAPVVLDIGERKIRVTKEGFRPYERALPVGGSADVNVDVALEKEVHEGRLIVEAPAGASIFLDDKPIGSGKVEQSVPSGGHQLRVTAPGMHPYQTEVIVQDKETRSVNVVLEPEAALERPMLRVAVGCGDPEPRAPEDGLVVYADGPDVLAPGPVKRRLSATSDRNIVEYVEYPIASGPHSIRVTITDCTSRDQAIVVDPVRGASISGALESSKFVLFRGPMGSPGWFRAGVGVWLASASVRENVPEEYRGKGLSITGAAAEVGAVTRWFGVYVNGAYGAGSLPRSTFNTNYALPNPAHVTFDQLILRLGPRFPFNLVSLGLGPSIGIEQVDLDQVRTGKKAGIIGAYGEIDVAPLCDWGLFGHGGIEKPTNQDEPSGTLQFGVFFEPNARCRTERATTYGLHANSL